MSLAQRIAQRLPSGMKTMARDSAWTLTFEISLVFSVTVSFALLGRNLGPERYGDYVTLFAITTPLSAIGSAAMLASMQYMFAEEKPISKVMSIFATITVVGGSVAVGVAIAIASFAVSSLPLGAIVAMAVGEIIFVPLGRVASAGVRALHGVPASVRVELSLMIARFLVLIAIFATGNLTVEQIAIGWAASGMIIVGWILLVVMPRDGIHVRPARIKVRDFRVAGALGAPIFISDFQTNGDKVVLNTAGLSAEAGLYGAAFRVVSLAFTPLRAMDIAVFHRFLQSDDSSFGQHTRRARLYSVASLGVVVPIAIALAFLAPFLKLILGDEFSESVEMTRWLLLWLPARAVSGAPLNGMLGLGRLGLRLIVLIVGAASAMAMYLILIPSMGWEGAVIGTIVAEFVLLVAGWVGLSKAQREHDQRLRARTSSEEFTPAV